MDSAYFRHEAGNQPRPAGPQQVQLVERRLQQEQHPQQQQYYHQQQHSFYSPLLQQQQPACADDACGARRYFVSPPFDSQNQQQQQHPEQQQQQTPLIPFSVTYPGASTTAPLGARGWLGELRLAAAAAASALQHIKENPIRRLLLFFAFCFFCFLLLHAARQPQAASTRLTSAETHGGICDDDYRENTLKLAHEASAFSLLANGWPERKFEASDVVASNKSLYFVCDSSFALMRTGFGLRPLAPENALIGSSERHGKSESDWEALWLDEVTHTFYVVREAVTHSPEEEEVEAPAETEKEQQQQQQQQRSRGGVSTKPFHAHVEELTVHGTDYTLQTTCKTHACIDVVMSAKGLFLLLIILFLFNALGFFSGLCEGNFCEGGSKGRTRGNGRMVLMKKETSGKSCKWITIKVLELPSEIEFADYSSVTTRGNSIAIASQEDSRMWLGRLNLKEIHSTSSKAPSVVLENPEQLQVLPGFPSPEE
ncbi:hypothetical protein Esti_005842 [Eimeria stiedai]